MPAPKGNSFWTLRSSHGRDKIFSSPEILEAACYEYLEACAKSPYKKQLAFANGKRTTVDLMRAPTMKGLYIFLDINRQTWENYKAQEGFLAIINKIEDIIYNEKLTGAMAGLLKENLVARELGLADKSEIDFERFSDEQLEYLVQQIMSKHEKR